MPDTQAIRPEKYVMQLDAITWHLAELKPGERNMIRVGKNRAGNPVITPVALDMPEHMLLEGSRTLSACDKAVIDGVTSLLECGNTAFSIPMLYQAMTGRRNPTISDPLSDDLCGRLERMRRMTLSIDLGGELEAGYITAEDAERLTGGRYSIEGRLLPLEREAGTVNGRAAQLYRVIKPPPIYAYAKLKRQLASVDIELLRAPVNNNPSTIPLKAYLLRRAEMLRNRKNRISSPVILYESIYRELGAEDSGKTKRMRLRSYTEAILNHFTRERHIRSHASFKRGGTVAGVTIEL